MDMSSVLVDANAYTAVRTGHEGVLDRLGRANTVIMSSIVLGELQAGFQNGRRVEQNLEMLQRFLVLPQVRIADVTAETAEHYGRLMTKLRRAGTPLPTNDVWLAAQAVQAGAVILTFDKHFYMMPEVRVWPETTRRTKK
ncbi:MAG: PIN domain-containing protein [Planctomycetes bacterium]|jgi:tRNA(fMet)-specific endonuclease VapC|nr:PIN domain-containing protein [Planctomycetota bacterium]